MKYTSYLTVNYYDILITQMMKYYNSIQFRKKIVLYILKHSFNLYENTVQYNTENNIYTKKHSAHITKFEEKRNINRNNSNIFFIKEMYLTVTLEP